MKPTHWHVKRYRFDIQIGEHVLISDTLYTVYQDAVKHALASHGFLVGCVETHPEPAETP